MRQPAISLDTPIGATSVSIGVSLFLIMLGLTALLMPMAVGIAMSMLILWIIVFSGLAHLVHAWDARSHATFLWRLSVGLLYVAGGIFLLLHPGYGSAFLTLFIAGMFCVEALLLSFTFFWLRSTPGAIWIAADALLTLFLATVIVLLWPWNPPWLLGSLVGINIIVSGLARLALARSGLSPWGHRDV